MPTSKTKPKKMRSSATLAAQVEQAIQLLDQVASMVTVSKSALTQADRKKAVKMRAGGEKFVPEIASLARRYMVSIGGHPVNAMTEKLQQVQTLRPLLARAQLLVTQLSDASLHGNAEVWDSATVLYGTLKRISHKNPEVQATLAPVKEFFARRSAPAGTKKAKGKAAATSSAPEPAPTGTGTTEVTATSAAPPAAPSVAPAAHA